MRCEDAQNQLNARVDGALRTEDAAELEAHLSECAQCRAHAEGLQAIDTELRRAFVPRREAATRLAESVAVAVRAAQLAPAATPVVPLAEATPRLDWGHLLTGLAAGFLLAIAIFRPWQARTMTSGALPPVNPVARLAVASGPVEVRPAKQSSFYFCPPHSQIGRESIVRTGPTARCEISLDNGNSLRLDFNTEVALHKSKVVEVKRGRVWSTSQPGRNGVEIQSAGGTIVSQDACQLAVDCQPPDVRLVVAQGEVSVRTRQESMEVGPGQQVRIVKGKLENGPRQCDPLLETAWVNSVLALGNSEHPELVERVNRLLANLGAAKLSLLYEDELRRLGDDGVAPLLAYLTSTRDNPNVAQRATAARIVADVAQSRWIADLIALLTDANPDVRFQAARGLERLTGRDQGCEPLKKPKAADDSCEPAHQKWLTWWASNRDRYPNAGSKPQIILRGRVLGPEDRPLANARLYLSIDEWTDPIELGTSDASGSYRFTVPEKTLRRTVAGGAQYGKHRASLIAAADGLGPGWAELPDVKGGRYGELKPEYVNDVHLPVDFPITGRVVSADGKGIAGVTVAVNALINLADPRWFKMHPAIKANDINLMSREQADVNNWFTPLYPTAWKMIPSATTDEDGRFRIVGVGADRAIRLNVTGPGIRSAVASVLTRDDVEDFTKAIREKYPRTRRPDGYFYPPREDSPEGDQGVQLFGPTPTIEVDPARTIAGIVRDASTGKPIAGVQVKTTDTFGAGAAKTDRDGRYRILRAEDAPQIAIYTQPDSDRYLAVVHQLMDAQGLGHEIVANFDIPRGVVVNGRVVEKGTDQPIVSAPRRHCHDTVPGPLLGGRVTYYPLATNAALRGTPSGLYFEGFPHGKRNNSRSASIDGDGRFQLAVPPGPGVLLIYANAGMSSSLQISLGLAKESEGLHRLFPYATLASRAKDDGAPEGDAQSFPGLMGPIPLKNHHTYHVINPAADAGMLDLTIEVPRAPSRVLRFVGPDDKPISGVKVQGLVAPPRWMIVTIDGSEAEVLALQSGQPRQVIAASTDGKYIARTFLDTDDLSPKTIQLKSAATVSGRLLDEDTGQPIAGFMASVGHRTDQDDENQQIHWANPAGKTDKDGRFQISGVIPDLDASVYFREPFDPGKGFYARDYKPEPLQNLTFDAGEVRDLGEIRIKLLPKPDN